MSNIIGQSLGRYHILEQLGEGGMATVYQAYDTRLETDVAVKIIRTENLTFANMERALKRFEREAKALARLTHPNIVKVTDYGEHEGKPYLVMTYLPGGTLKQKLGQPIPWQKAARLLLPIARALDYAHRQNMIHRDVKPSNILVTADGEPMLTDFGIAKILDLEETVDLTGTGMGIGTPEYMAPEQWTGKTSMRTDQYALGVVFYEMVTGRKPYTADTPAAILLKQANDPLPRPGQFTRDLPEHVEKLLLKAMAKNPQDRFTSMGELAAALEGILIGLSPSASKSQQEDRAEQIGFGTRALADTRATSEPTEEAASAPRPRPAPGAHPNWLRYWPVLAGVTAITLILIVTQATGEGQPLADTEAPASGFPTEAPLTEIPATEATVLLDEITDSKGVAMRLVPAGEFTMGSDRVGESPIHQVYLDAYYMDKYEVTNGLYRICVTAGVCELPLLTGSASRYEYYTDTQFDNHPVVTVEWNMAKTYCEWRGARLPTEAEWEKAARGTDGRTYPWGEGIDCTRANYKGLANGCIGDTVAVGSYVSGASPYGLFDMSGSVWEWTADWYSETYYQGSPFENPLGPDNGQFHVLRGGALNSNENAVRSANRFQTLPLFTDYIYIGFRCALSQNAMKSTTNPALSLNNSIEIGRVIGVGNVETEVVKIRYLGEDPLNLTNWRLADENGNLYIFPNLSLYTNGTTQIHSSAGTDTIVDLYWNRSTPIWSSGEKVSLYDAQGNLRAVYTVH